MNKLDPGTSLKVGSHDVEIVKYLAEGGFAYIYTVKYTPVEEEREIGVLKRVIVKSKTDLNILRKEVEVMKQLSKSDYVVRLYDSNAQKLEDGTYEVLLLMEYCPNGSLLDYMNLHLKTKLNFEQITKIMYQISVGVYSMHKINLIHRDLKIENVLIDADGNFKLADFGSSSAFIPPPNSPEEFQYIANDITHNTTPQYRAPEMIDLYRNIPIDNKSDIWALGVLLYKLLYYTTPFEAQGNFAILHGYFQFPAHPKYTSKLKNLVIIMLQVAPQLRPNIYQVIHEVCRITGEPLKIEDFYGDGPYDFDAYTAYQQQIQIEQQKQQQQQQQQLQLQQQYLQQQKLLEDQKLAQQTYEKQQKELLLLQHAQYQTTDQLKQQRDAQRSGASSNEHPLIGEKTKDSILNSRPLELARSSKSSVGDLKSLGDEVDGQEQEDDDDLQDSDIVSPTDDFSNVEERFPDLEQLDENIVIQKYPDLSEEEPRNPMVDTPSSLSRKTSIKSKAHTEASEPLSGERGEDPENLGLKLAKTEAWTTSGEDNHTNDLQIDGVFHKEYKIEPSKTSDAKISPGQKASAPALNRKDTFDSLFEYEASRKNSPAPTSANIRQPSNPKAPYPSDSYSQPFGSPISKNPFPVRTGNPFPQPSQANYGSSSSVYDQGVKIEASGKNPWANYTTKPPQPQHHEVGYQQQQNIPQLTQKQTPYPQGQHYQQPPGQLLSKASYGYNPQPQYQNYQQSSQIQPQAPPKPPRPVISKPDITSSSRNTSNKLQSPLVTITNEEKLIDLDEKQAKPRPQLNLDLLDMEFNKLPVPKRQHSISSEKSDTAVTEIDINTDTDSEGELRVQEMQVPKSRKASGQSQSSIPYIDSTNPNQEVSKVRKSSELTRLNLDFEELDLGKENDASDNSETDDESKRSRHSRRSMSLRRPVSGVRNSERSRSRSKPSIEQEKKSDYRKSFLGF